MVNPMPPNSLINRIEKQLDLVGRKEQTTLIAGFLGDRESNVREFIKYCATRANSDGTLHQGWIQLGKALEKTLSEEKRKAEDENRASFLVELERFKQDCMQGECVRCADFDDKRRAYADGDIYFEEFQYDFIDGHDDIQAYIGYVGKADYYYKRGDYETAMRAYGILMDIYHHDTEVTHCFVEDDDFPDMDLSEIGKIDVDGIKKRYETCVVSLKDEEMREEYDSKMGFVE